MVVGIVGVMIVRGWWSGGGGEGGYPESFTVLGQILWEELMIHTYFLSTINRWWLILFVEMCVDN